MGLGDFKCAVGNGLAVCGEGCPGTSKTNLKTHALKRVANPITNKNLLLSTYNALRAAEDRLSTS